MKKIFALIVCALVCLTGVAQYAPWEPSQGPLNFMTLTAPYVKCRTGTSSSVNSSDYNSQSAVIGTGSLTTHQIVTTQSADPCRCFNIPGTTIYNKDSVLPYLWMDTSLVRLSSVIKLGCTACNSGISSCVCSRNSEIEYWFYPQTDSSTLLVYFTFAEDDITYHPANENPRFYIEVLDANGTLLDLGYYKNQNGQIMSSKPYSRFCAVPSGQDNGQDTYFILPENQDLGITTFYWAFSETTPTNFNFQSCPKDQIGSAAAVQGNYVKWFQYKPLAFDLSKQARQGQSVKLRIRVRSCDYNTHWSTAMFYAKMIPGTIQVDACGNEPIHLSVPWGLDERTYLWRCGYDSLHASTRPPFDPIDPPVGITTQGDYDIFIDRDAQIAAGQPVWPYYRCEMRSYTGVPFVYEAHIKAYYLQPDFTFQQLFENCDLRAKLIDSSLIYTMTPPTQNGGSWDTVYQNTENIQWFVKNQSNQNFDSIPNHYGDTSFTYVFQHPYIDTLTGEAFIKIVIQDSLQKCIKDTIKRIQLDLKAIRDTMTKDTVYTCEEKLPYVFDRAYFGETHTWATEGTRRVTYDTLAWNGCDSIVDVTLIVRKPKVEITSDPEYCEAFTTNLTVECEDSNDSILSCIWNNGETAPFTTITAPGTYSVEIMNKDSCTATSSIVIPACKPFLNLPNSITPSKIDGVNDYFYIPQSNLIKELEFTVFNRHGVVVYHTTNKDFEWNGTENGKLFVGATYTYTLRIVDYEGVASWHKGSITVL